MRIVFMGTPDFAVRSLLALLEAGHTVAGVFTQADKPKGRGYKQTPPAVKVAALEQGLPVYQPQSLRGEEAAELLKSLAPELIVVVAYGKILPLEVLEIPKRGSVNVHASLLPKYRGAAPIQWSVLNGDKVTGVTTMLLNEGMDTGAVLMKSQTVIGPEETAGELHDRLAVLGAELLTETLEKMERGMIVAQPQEHGLASYAPMLNKSMGIIDWTKPAEAVYNQIRGLSPWPAASTVLQGKTLKIHAARRGAVCKGAPGEIMQISPLFVCCGDGHGIELVTVQPESGRKMDAASYLAGHPAAVGTVLGGR